ncbi:UDP-2,4-diacetamido-2,4,6-trideoxy-beta-L-altropyranose hydrolase [Arcobacter roscoffensis]|uniref:UDP-2,4-diacetamido-2,4, 6-trideoxy-beta-L-altropyranose hydrolase n=1 Tax=Arcobacter roscoffensis TaxID=2961520 RepID=A0ABY5E6I2_9BACT|nr:UDP-2,4-diacetamido-2,4,6-trideoxy-beta-L-altropyranose hydrolase [Arcobacter roscoffensis]UTJ06371.1 UDP-2,4-diacetamido-2,4,6-trideoxy-beta-L-altropyranose hydrolase [Arcobacter roscoffensis]
MNILIRVNSSSSIGLGHLSRCLVLANKYKKKNNRVIFACEELKGNANSLIIEEGFELLILKDQSIDVLVNTCKANKIDLLVIDSYDFDYKYEKSIKQKLNIKLLCFDDTYEKHYCDEVLNHNISAKKKKYKNLVPSFCKVKCGSKYTLLREEFKKTKRVKLKKSKKVHKVLLMMGGTDHSFLNIKILDILLKYNFKIDVVTSSSNKNLDKLSRTVKDRKKVTLHINTARVATLMSKSDFAIISPSVALNEVIYMKLPFIAIKTASNQNDMFNFSKEKRFCTLKKFHNKKLEKEIEKLIRNYEKFYKRNTIFR